MSDTAQKPTRLHAVTPQQPTTQPDEGYTSFCRDNYDCQCETCTAETARRVARGIRPRQPIPTRRAA